MKKLLSSFFLIIASTSFSQNFDWQVTGDTYMTDHCDIMVSDKSDRIYALQGGYSSGQSGYWAKSATLHRLNPEGAKIWSRGFQFGYFGAVNALNVDDVGNAYVGVDNMTQIQGDTSTDDHAGIYKLDTLGNIRWKVSATSNSWVGSHVCTNSAGSSLYSAEFYMNGDHDSTLIFNGDSMLLTTRGIFLAMLNSDGTTRWKQYIQCDGYPGHLSAISKSYLAISGHFTNTITINGTTYSNLNQHDRFLALFRNDGTLAAFKSYTGSYVSQGTYGYANNYGFVFADSSNNFYLANPLNFSFTYGTYSVQPGFQGNENQSSIICKLDTALKLVWASQIAAQQVFGMNASNSSGILVGTSSHLFYKLDRTTGAMLVNRCDNSSNYCGVELSTGKTIIGGAFQSGSVFGEPYDWHQYYTNIDDYYIACLGPGFSSTQLQAAFSCVDTVCADIMVFLRNASVNADRFTWKTDGQLASQAVNCAMSFSVAGNHSVTLVAYRGNVADSLTRVIYVKPLPSLVITAPSHICAPDSIVQFTKTGAADSILWNYDSEYNQVWYESNNYNWQDTIHWGKDYVPDHIFYSFNVYKDGCSHSGNVTVENSVPGCGRIFLENNGSLHAGVYTTATRQWYLNGNALAGETGEYLAPSATGYYQCRFGDSCYYFSNKIYISGTGVAENVASGVSLYPNPAKTAVKITGSSVLLSVEVFDLQGKQLLACRPESTSIEIRTPVNAGLYLVRVTTQEGVTMQRLIVE